MNKPLNKLTRHITIQTGVSFENQECGDLSINIPTI